MKANSFQKLINGTLNSTRRFSPWRKRLGWRKRYDGSFMHAQGPASASNNAVFVLRLSDVNLLTVKNLTVRIEDKLIIDDLNFDLKPRERLSILGPNGAGKT